MLEVNGIMISDFIRKFIAYVGTEWHYQLNLSHFKIKFIGYAKSEWH